MSKVSTLTLVTNLSEGPLVDVFEGLVGVTHLRRNFKDFIIFGSINSEQRLRPRKLGRLKKTLVRVRLRFGLTWVRKQNYAPLAFDEEQLRPKRCLSLSLSLFLRLLSVLLRVSLSLSLSLSLPLSLLSLSLCRLRIYLCHLQALSDAFKKYLQHYLNFL